MWSVLIICGVGMFSMIFFHCLFSSPVPAKHRGEFEPLGLSLKQPENTPPLTRESDLFKG